MYQTSIDLGVLLGFGVLIFFFFFATVIFLIISCPEEVFVCPGDGQARPESFSPWSHHSSHSVWKPVTWDLLQLLLLISLAMMDSCSPDNEFGWFVTFKVALVETRRILEGCSHGDSNLGLGSRVFRSASVVLREICGFSNQPRFFQNIPILSLSFHLFVVTSRGFFSISEGSGSQEKCLTAVCRC